MIKIQLHNNWEMHNINDSQWIPATVPGSVYGDLLNAGKMEDPFWKDNEDEATKLMDEDYEYKTVFDCDDSLLSSDEVILHFDGLDTLADITLNGKLLGHVENMHRTYEFSVKELLSKEGNELKIHFYSPTKFIAEAYKKSPTRGTEDAMDGFVHIRKAHCMFGWDWGAHLPDAGIWRPVSLLGVDTARIDSVEVLQFHEDGKVRLEINPEILIASTLSSLPSGISTKVSVTDPDGTVNNYDCCIKEIIIENPKLWWPNGYGKQDLYTVSVDLVKEDGTVIDNWTRKIGLRTITMDRTPDKWGERFATCVNGVNIFAMGADYIPEDHLLGRVTKETTRTLLEKAVFANFNSIRVWGGGYYPDDWFFDLCDEMGLVVWEDFMFACAVYDLTPEFEANITAEFIDNLKRIRHHASLGLMCGNNEMEQFVKERTWVSKDSEVRDYIIMYERILPKIMEQYAKQIYYWPASPSSGGSFDDPRDENRGDVHYWDVWHGNRPFSEYRKFYFRYLSEFGFQAFPSKKTVETFTDDERDMNIFSYIMEKHQRNGAANGKIMNYMQQTYRYPSTFETVIYASQLLQADAIRYGVEHFRRNRNDSRCMGAVYWQFNDCWPVASWSSVDYCQRLKALHYYAKRFFAPIMISCEEEGMINSGQELVRLPFGFAKSIKLSVANESMYNETVTVKWQLRDKSSKVLRSEETTIEVPALTSVWLEKVDLPDVDIYNEYVSYQAVKDGVTVSEGTVIFSFPKYFRYEDPELKATVDGNKITVTASKYAKSVEILNDNEDLILSDNYFDLNGDSKTVEVLSGNIDNLRLRSVYDIG
ncbi:MAG: glycoside hydrolase family 2 protein [Lachnospiraceae bacterium]|nr:glycoside hydrolase family 2 protein [Lachnospiraceae bacterium]